MGKIIELPVGSQLEIGKAGSLKPDFHIMTAGIEPDRHNDRLVHMTGSSTVDDLEGDSMSIHALNSMTEMASNLTIWLNHDYTLPDSIFGSIQGRAGIFHQNGIADLKFVSDVEMENPAAARVKKYIDNGRRLGCSVGCMVTKYEVPDPEEGEDWFERGIIIHGVYVVEFSIVGIPCNQRSWVENGIKGVFQRSLDYRLAPAMKSLWPRQYQEMMKNKLDANHAIDSRIMDAPTRKGTVGRINWHAPTKTFIFNGAPGIHKSLTREDLAAFLSGDSKELRGEVVEVEEDDTEPKGIDAAALDIGTDGEKDMDLKIIKNIDEVIGFALNKDGSAGIEITKSGNHAPTVGTHRHFHAAHGHNDVAMHHHDHSHDGDNIHHHDHSAVPDASTQGQDADPDQDGDIDTSKEVTPEIVKDGSTVVEMAPIVPLEKKETPLLDVLKQEERPILPLTDSNASFLLYNVLGKSLGLPEVTQEHLKALQHPALLKAMPPEHQGHVNAIHDHAAAMGGCNYVNSASGESVSDARNEAAYASGRGVVAGDHMDGIGRLSDVMGSLAKSFEGLDLGGIQKDVTTLKSEMGEARKQIDAVYAEAAKAAETVKALKEMPIGNPVHLSRSVSNADATVSHQELLAVKDSQVSSSDTLESALALTTTETQTLRNGTKMSYRRWPAAVGKSVRPLLTLNQRTFMLIEEIKAYEEGLDARVPLIDDPTR